MLKHATEMEKLYGKLKQCVTADPPDDDEIKNSLDFLEKKNTWFEKAEVRVGKMFNNLQLPTKDL